LFLAFALVLPLVETARLRLEAGRPGAVKAVLVLAVFILAGLALILPSSVGQWDWNGVFQWIFTLLLWCTLAGCFYFLGRPRASYSWPAIIAVLLVTGASYKILQFADVVWGKSLGPTDDDVSRAFEQYASLDLSFRFAHHLLGNAAREEPCDDFCR